MFFNRWLTAFRKYEKSILKSIESELENRAQKLFRAQLNQVNKVVRSNSDKEVNMYRMKRGKPSFDKEIQFALDLPEVKLAEVKIEYKNDDKRISLKKLTAELWIVNGYIFSLTFNISPKFLKKEPFEITEIIILENPLKKIELITIKVEHSYVEKWLKDVLVDFEIKKLFAPFPEEIHKKRTKEFECKLPSDWIELMNYCNGFELEQCSVYGFYNMRQVVTNDTELLILTEGYGSKILSVDKTKNDGHVYCIDVADDTGKFVDFGEYFKEALKKYLND